MFESRFSRRLLLGASLFALSAFGTAQAQTTSMATATGGTGTASVGSTGNTVTWTISSVTTNPLVGSTAVDLASIGGYGGGYVLANTSTGDYYEGNGGSGGSALTGYFDGSGGAPMPGPYPAAGSVTTSPGTAYSGIYARNPYYYFESKIMTNDPSLILALRTRGGGTIVDANIGQYMTDLSKPYYLSVYDTGPSTAYGSEIGGYYLATSGVSGMSGDFFKFYNINVSGDMPTIPAAQVADVPEPVLGAALLGLLGVGAAYPLARRGRSGSDRRAA